MFVKLNYSTSINSYEMKIKPLKDIEKDCVYFSIFFFFPETSPMLINDWKELCASQLKAS